MTKQEYLRYAVSTFRFMQFSAGTYCLISIVIPGVGYLYIGSDLYAGNERSLRLNFGVKIKEEILADETVYKYNFSTGV